MSIETIWASKE